jgi:hypothetical protein
MSHLELSAEEQALLKEVLDHSFRDLEVEVRRTDSIDYKGMLKERKLVMEHLIGKLEAAALTA